MKAEQQATSRNMEPDKKRVIQLSEESKCPLCMQPLDGQYKGNLLERIAHENVEREKTISQLRIEIDGLQKTKLAASEAFSNLQACLTRVEDLKDRMAEEENNLNNLTREFEEKQKLEGDLRLQLATVQFEIGKFDLSELRLPECKGSKLFGNIIS